MTVNFMGLTGPMGVLPYTYSELILERSAPRITDWLHSSTSSIIAPSRSSIAPGKDPAFPVTYSAGARDLFTRYLLDLIGLGTDGLRDRQEIEDEALLHYASLVGHAVPLRYGTGANHRRLL